jgi:hypothetical protein
MAWQKMTGWGSSPARAPQRKAAELRAKEAFNKLIVDYYEIFAESYYSNSERGCRDAREDSFGMSSAGL